MSTRMQRKHVQMRGNLQLPVAADDTPSKDTSAVDSAIADQPSRQWKVLLQQNMQQFTRLH